MKRRQEQRLGNLERELLKQEETDLPKDKVEFFKEVLGIKPYPYQASFLKDPSALKVIRWCRRAGKTTVMSGDDIYFAANNPGETIIVTMPKYQQIKEIYFGVIDRSSRFSSTSSTYPLTLLSFVLRS